MKMHLHHSIECIFNKTSAGKIGKCKERPLTKKHPRSGLKQSHLFQTKLQRELTTNGPSETCLAQPISTIAPILHKIRTLLQKKDCVHALPDMKNPL